MHITLSLVKNGEVIELSIEDNGVGFDVEAAFSSECKGKGLGLTSMRERTELSGGALLLNQLQGRGRPYGLHGLLSNMQPPIVCLYFNVTGCSLDLLRFCSHLLAY